VQELQAFLGLLNFYRCFVSAAAAAPSYAEIVAGTTTVLPGNGPQAGLTHRVAAAGLHLLSPGSGPQAGLTPEVATAGLRLHSPGSSPQASSTPMVAAAGLHHPSSAGPPPVAAATAAGGSGPSPPPASAPPVDIRDLAAAQSSCPDCAQAVSSPALRVESVSLSGQQVLVDLSSGVMRPLVPAAYRRAIFDNVHGLAHPGIRATRRLIASRYLWPNLAKEVADWCRACHACQRAKVCKQPPAAMQPVPVPTTHFLHVHVDLVGPLPCSADGFAYIMTAVDRSTRWAEAWPLKATAAADCAEVFIAGWVARFGVPAFLTSDRGVQFTSALWVAVMGRLGISHKMTSAFHPQSNGAVEGFHRRLKDALRARLAAADWPSHLPLGFAGPAGRSQGGFWYFGS
jgi:transposase InsO family protein